MEQMKSVRGLEAKEVTLSASPITLCRATHPSPSCTCLGHVHPWLIRRPWPLRLHLLVLLNSIAWKREGLQ